MRRERILVTGASGCLGTALIQHDKAEGRELITPTHEQMDVADYEACDQRMVGMGIEAIIHTAAMTNWEVCHKSRDKAEAVNARGALNMARLARKHKAKLILVSTDAVFSGEGKPGGYTEEDRPGNPTSVYGLTKLRGELYAQLVDPEVLIARIGWLFGPNPEVDKKFITMMVRQIADGRKTMKAVYDKEGTLAYAEDVAGKIWGAVDGDGVGKRHYANTGKVSRWGVAVEIANLWGQGRVLVEGVDSSQFVSEVVRPSDVALSTIYEEARMRTWQEALRAYYEIFPNPWVFIQAIAGAA